MNTIPAVIVSFRAFIFTVIFTYNSEQCEKNQAALEALNVLQEQAFDNPLSMIFVKVTFIYMIKQQKK